MITDKYIWRIYYGVLFAALVFAFIWETLKTGRVPSIPLPTGLVIVALTGSPAALAFLNKE